MKIKPLYAIALAMMPLLAYVYLVATRVIAQQPFSVGKLAYWLEYYTQAPFSIQYTDTLMQTLVLYHPGLLILQHLNTTTDILFLFAAAYFLGLGLLKKQSFAHTTLTMYFVAVSGPFVLVGLLDRIALLQLLCISLLFWLSSKKWHIASAALLLPLSIFGFYGFFIGLLAILYHSTNIKNHSWYIALVACVATFSSLTQFTNNVALPRPDVAFGLLEFGDTWGVAITLLILGIIALSHSWKKQDRMLGLSVLVLGIGALYSRIALVALSIILSIYIASFLLSVKDKHIPLAQILIITGSICCVLLSFLILAESIQQEYPSQNLADAAQVISGKALVSEEMLPLVTNKQVVVNDVIYMQNSSQNTSELLAQQNIELVVIDSFVREELLDSQVKGLRLFVQDPNAYTLLFDNQEVQIYTVNNYD